MFGFWPPEVGGGPGLAMINLINPSNDFEFLPQLQFLVYRFSFRV